MRQLLACLVLLVAAEASLAAATDQARLLAAARAANQTYQRHLARLQADLAGPDEAARLRAIVDLGRTLDPAVVPLLTPLLDLREHPPAHVRAAAIALSTMGVETVAPQLRVLAANQDPEIRAIGVGSLARLDRLEFRDFEQQATAPTTDLRSVAVSGLAATGANEAGSLLRAVLRRDRKPFNRRLAAAGLARLRNPAYGPDLTDALTDPDPFVRRYAAEGLVAIDHQPAIPELLLALEGRAAVEHLHRALLALAGQDFGYSPHADERERHAAITRAFNWWTARQRSDR